METATRDLDANDEFDDDEFALIEKDDGARSIVGRSDQDRRWLWKDGR